MSQNFDFLNELFGSKDKKSRPGQRERELELSVAQYMRGELGYEDLKERVSRAGRKFDFRRAGAKLTIDR